MSIPPGRLSKAGTLVYLGLVAATLASWELPGTVRSVASVTAAVLGIAALKIVVIGLEFMELRRAHWVLRSIFLAWVAAVGITLLALFSLPP